MTLSVEHVGCFARSPIRRLAYGCRSPDEANSGFGGVGRTHVHDREDRNDPMAQLYRWTATDVPPIMSENQPQEVAMLRRIAKVFIGLFLACVAVLGLFMVVIAFFAVMLTSRLAPDALPEMLHPTANELRWLLAAVAILFPLWFFRYARSLWLGLDQYFDPLPRGDSIEEIAKAKVDARSADVEPRKD